MEQKALRDIESRCIQEQQPWCQSSCPLHVDARTFLAQAARGQWAPARKTLERAMPFPGILGRVCDHPCESSCKRAESGGAIRIHGVERTCVEQAGPQTKALPIPAKSGHAAVIGAGLAGMTVALDLARKAWRVTLHVPGDALGGDLRKQYGEDRVPVSEWDEALAILKKFKVDVRFGANPDQALIDTALDECAAVFLDRDGAGALVTDTPDPETLALGREHCFAGGGPEADGRISPMRQAADGRRAGNSLDRLLQGVSLTLNRTGEGPCDTALYTSLEGIDPVPPVAVGDAGGYTTDEAMAEAARCLQCECKECVKACTYLEQYKGYPKLYARQVYNNLAIVKGHHQSNTFINSCALCGQCTAICPTDFDMADLCLSARRAMVERGKMPPSAHDFALQDLRFTQGSKSSLFRNAPGSNASAWLFFPGCQLSGSDPELVERVYAWLRDSLDGGGRGGVGLALDCCGAPALWAGQQAWFERTMRDLEARRQELGGPTVVTACMACAEIFHRHAPDMPVRTIWDVLAEAGAPEAARPASAPLALYDPCMARDLPEAREGLRTLLRGLGQDVEEVRYNGDLAACCGYGGLQYNANPDLAHATAQRRANESGLPALAWCAMCRDRMARTGKDTVHALELFFPASDSDKGGAARPDPGFSQRQENRARLKARLSATLWHEEALFMEPYAAIELVCAPEVEAILEERRILRDDVRRAIHHAESSGRRLTNPAGRFLASHKPVRVTYWVEYTPEGDGFRVHNAYCHRMTLPGMANGVEDRDCCGGGQQGGEA